MDNPTCTHEGCENPAAYRLLIAADPCVYCGAPGTAVDHIHPVARGGSDRWDNLAPVCQPCNSTKHSRSLLGVLLARR